MQSVQAIQLSSCIELSVEESCVDTQFCVIVRGVTLWRSVFVSSMAGGIRCKKMATKWKTKRLAIVIKTAFPMMDQGANYVLVNGVFQQRLSQNSRMTRKGKHQDRRANGSVCDTWFFGGSPILWKAQTAPYRLDLFEGYSQVKATLH